MQGIHNNVARSLNGEIFSISPSMWQQNQQNQQLLLRYFAFPLQENEHTLWLGLDSLTNLSACETFSFLTGKMIEPVAIDKQELKQLLQQLSPHPNKLEEPLLYYPNPITENEPENSPDEPVIQLLNHIFEQALQQNASDIHLETQSNQLQIRFRIDGVLQVQEPISLNLANRLISRLKLLAKLDISETRLPQDGAFQFKTTLSDTIDFRLSTLPTPKGEKAVLRLQHNKPVQFSFAELGMNLHQQRLFQQALNQPQGLILVTGPTGSGKSISLYTALEWLNQPEKHIMTAEDPIEIELNGIIQTQVNKAIGLDFSRLLRTFLRQDPDIIMLGEIRDEESAAIALRAAQTGHLVLSTLHTNDAPSAISRLLQLGIKQHEIDSSLLLVIAQRLLRKCCSQCNQNRGQKKPHFSTCDCYQGYKGRIGIYQFLQPNKQTYTLDFATLHLAAQEKLNAQLTDLAEINRILGEHNA
ncbi:MAG: GspE/PulE family protein [Pasteurellaceae bacterium]|nr:GspE/PulE family protein [Pasteurellaceae bacterium]